MAKKSLRSGYTTGACAAAAAKGAALLLRDGVAEMVEIDLPAGFRAQFSLQGQMRSDVGARCFVIKDAGDDPDVTHGVELHADIRYGERPGLEIVAGDGIGTVTKPGLAVPVGQSAINPVPWMMIEQAVGQIFSGETGLRLTLSIPDGEQRAAKTLNAKLGILGGLSLLGTTGVVTPLSHAAWTDTIDVEIDVAQAAGVSQVILVTGRTSEGAARDHFACPEEAFVMMGDFISHALESCHRKGVQRLAITGQFAKVLKIACGHPQTHVRNAQLDLKRLHDWGQEIGLDPAECQRLELANTARQVFEQYGSASPLVERVCSEALAVCRRRVPGADLSILLVDYQGRIARVFEVD